jgi:hypothetical protein
MPTLVNKLARTRAAPVGVHNDHRLVYARVVHHRFASDGIVPFPV